MTKTKTKTSCIHLIILCLSTIVASEVHYIIRTSQSLNCGDQYSNAESVDNCLTLSQFIDNSIDVYLSEFINNRAIRAVVYIHVPYYTTVENLTNDVFIDSSAAYEVLISSDCRPGLSLSFGISHCIPCTENWHQNLIGIVIAAFIAGIALVISSLC